MSYVLLSMFWSIAGLTAGYWLGRASRTDPPPEAALVPTFASRRDQLLGALLVVLAVLSVIASAVYLRNQQELIERQTAAGACQNAYNRAFADTLAQRNEVAAREREGQRRLLAAAFESTDPEASLAAYREYLVVLAQTDAEREANPLPVQVC